MTDKSPRIPCSNRSARERVPLIGTRATADFHQGAQPSCCNPDAVYMAAPEFTPASTETLLPRGSHPYMVRETMANALMDWLPWSWRSSRTLATSAPTAPKLRRTPWRIGSGASWRVARAGMDAHAPRGAVIDGDEDRRLAFAGRDANRVGATHLVDPRRGTS